MKKTPVLIIVFIIVVVVVVFLMFSQNRSIPLKNQRTTNENELSKLSAQSAYQVALLEAMKKAKDSHLVDLYGQVDNKGKTSLWYAEFYSGSLNKVFKVFVKGRVVEQVQDIKSTKSNEIETGWKDSDEIINIGLAQCGDVIKNTYFMSLEKRKDMQWSINCLTGENKTLRVYINALTGELIKTSKAGIGW